MALLTDMRNCPVQSIYKALKMNTLESQCCFDASDIGAKQDPLRGCRECMSHT